MTVKPNQLDALPQSYVSLTKALDFPNHDQELWWTKSAPLLARIMESANYSLHQQYQFLTLYNTLLVPFMGPFQHTWHCSITHSGIPVEFSVNYQEHGVRTVRIGYEPVSYISGTARDQYNMITADNAVNRIARLQLPSFDPQLYSGFMRYLALDTDEAATLKGAKLPSSNFKTQAAFGLDLKGDKVTVKSYVYPALKAHITGKPFHQLLSEAVKGQGEAMQLDDAVAMVSDYMTAGDCYNQYSFIGFDCKTPSASRLKIYGAILDISWEKVKEIWTLGGRLSDQKGNQIGLNLLEKLWGFLTPHKNNRPVGIWNYELMPGVANPEPKFYIDLNGEPDHQKLAGITSFFEHLGWTETAKYYPSTLQSYFPEANLQETTNLIQYVSFAWTEKTGPYLSIYYHSRY